MNPKYGTVVFTAAAALLLTGCGDGTDSADKGANSATPSASVSASALSEGVERPVIKLPKDVTEVFEDDRTGDPRKDAVLADNEERIKAVTEAITVDSEQHPALEFYSAGDALITAAEYIKTFYDDGRSFVGETRYYDREVTFLKDGAAVVTYCQDGTETYPMDRRTKKVDWSVPASPNDYVFYNTRLERNADGIWQTTSVTSVAAAKRCM
jgi:hypothetical protein